MPPAHYGMAVCANPVQENGAGLKRAGFGVRGLFHGAFIVSGLGLGSVGV